MFTRNFEPRVSPVRGQRAGRYVLAGSTALPMGVPVVTTGANDGLGRAKVSLAGEAAATPVNGQGGTLNWETVFYKGLDPVISTFSDVDTAPVDEAVQVWSGDEVKVCFTNTATGSQPGRPGYPKGRIMVAGLGGATPTVAVGDLLTPGVGNDTDGYWKVTNDPTKAWYVVESVDHTTASLEARSTF